jgi:hypothetical protein
MPAGSMPPAGLPVEPGREPIYRIIRTVTAADAVIGLLLAIFGPMLTGAGSLRVLGLGLFLVGTGLYLFFGRLAARARRQ